MSPVRVIKTKERAMAPALERDESCLYIRRDIFPDKTYEEFAYVGPSDYVAHLASRCTHLDMEKVDELLRKGRTFEQAIKELGA